MHWSRAARTDKGVHAAGNVLSLHVPPPLHLLLHAESRERYAELFRFLLLVKRVDPTSCADACDAAGAAARTYRCAVCSVSVPRYDHYCAWVDEPVGAANHRAYLGFVASMSSTCLLGGAQIVSVVMAGADGWSLASAWQANQSSVMLSFALYAIVIGVAVLTLLVHQLILILSVSS